ncbi:MAG: c-type cytochrome [Burkholderiales bacterium]
MRRAANVLAALAVLGLAAAPDASARGNAEAGKVKAVQGVGGQPACAICHGADGAKPTAPDQPILAGQYYDYLVKALSDYKTGKRANAIMKGIATPLSKQDIEDLSAWFASQKSNLHFQR